MTAAKLVFWALATFGHAALWVAVVNRWHATGFSRPVIKSVTVLFYAALVAPFAWVAWLLWNEDWSTPALAGYLQTTGVVAYALVCAIYGAVHAAIWLPRRRALDRHPQAVDVAVPQVVDLAASLGSSPARGWRAQLLSRVPGNELWRLHVTEAAVTLPALPPELAGLSIVHWSDLHLSGRIDRGYFREMVRLTQKRPADLLVLTGDICDSARCIDWIGELFGPATARLGKYFILGNHDLRTRDVPRLRAAMADAGFTDVGGRQIAIANGRIVLAGDERPWFPGEPPRELPADALAESLKILLAHTPDRLAWARSRQFDLLLAGHTHGGQIRFPLIGPVICPSWHGMRYASGFYHEPPTLMHVSRGTASLFPLRWGCPPEIARLVLRSGVSAPR
ncbi:MAG: metallophosphoesterase [Pirellulales bacterium]